MENMSNCYLPTDKYFIFYQSVFNYLIPCQLLQSTLAILEDVQFVTTEIGPGPTPAALGYGAFVASHVA